MYGQICGLLSLAQCPELRREPGQQFVEDPAGLLRQWSALLVQFSAKRPDGATALGQPLTIVEHRLNEGLQTVFGIRVVVPVLTQRSVVTEVTFDQGLAKRFLRLEKVVHRAQGHLSLLGDLGEGGLMKAL